MENKDIQVSITEVPHGPYIVKGVIKLTTKDGKESVLDGTNALCRCGRSLHKPFCDGTHRNINFEKDEE